MSITLTPVEREILVGGLYDHHGLWVFLWHAREDLVLTDPAVRRRDGNGPTTRGP